MAKATNFGTSAYLRITLLNPRPMETAIKNRVSKVEKSGMDYHASLRRAVNAYIKSPDTLQSIHEGLDIIKNQSEKQSAKRGLKSTVEFLLKASSPLFVPEEKKFVHAGGLFAVKFQPNLGIVVGDNKLSIHLWNTKNPRITDRAAQAVLCLFASMYEENEKPAILCLKSMRLFTMRKISQNMKIASATADRIDALIEKHIIEPTSEKSAKSQSQ